MARRGHQLTARSPWWTGWFAVLLLAAVGVLAPVPARALGDSVAFSPRFLLVGEGRVTGVRASAPARWSWELTRRTSAPARLAPEPVRADDPALLAEPFAWWIGADDPGALTPREVSTLQRFFTLGGVLLVDDSDPQSGRFGAGARRELRRVLPDSMPVSVGVEHVLFRSFYLLRRAYGRVAGPADLEVIVRGGNTQVILTSHDLAGALAQDSSGLAALPVVPGGENQRELAMRLAVNVAMYVLCANYKDDQVHAPFIMRRRARDTR